MLCKYGMFNFTHMSQNTRSMIQSVTAEIPITHVRFDKQTIFLIEHLLNWNQLKQSYYLKLLHFLFFKNKIFNLPSHHEIKHSKNGYDE